MPLAVLGHALDAARAPKAAEAAAEVVLSLKVGERHRRAILVNAPEDGVKRPAVVVLHGGMGSAEQMRLKSGFDAVAKRHDFMVAYGEGTDFGDGRHAWNTGHLLRRQVKDADDIGYLDALLDRLVAEHGADPARLHLTGSSNGGMMAFVYAVRRAERLAAVAPVVATMFSFDGTPSVPLPILLINGAKDEEVPLLGGMSGNPLVRAGQASPFKPVGEVVAFWVRANRSIQSGEAMVVGSVTTTTHAAEEGGAPTVFILDSAGGHGWPGSEPQRDGSAPIASFRGAERVWEFFPDNVRVAPGAKERADAKDRADAQEPATRVAPALQPIEVIEFPDLVDPTRVSATANAAPRRRLFRSREEEPRPAGRKVPVKVLAPTQAGPHPVIVLSHGAGGDWNTHHAQARDLAQHGYVVLCVEHTGSNRARLDQGVRILRNLDAMIRDPDEVLGRPKDITFVLDRAKEWNESHPRLRGKLDLGKVGALGHSFGAFTTMVVCGMRPALDWLEPRVDAGKGLGPNLRDPRVRCGVALSPQGVGEPFFLAESFTSLETPLLGISGTKDDQQAGQPAENRKEAFDLWPSGPHAFVWLANASHLDFTDPAGSDGDVRESATRADVQPVTRLATRAFFDVHLKGDAEAGKTLSVAGLAPSLRGAVDAVEVSRKP
ncbi:MAG: PHB depolymerase family esterase [Planctomycetia bacterium]